MLGEYGVSATDVRAEFIWMSPEVGASDDSEFGGDDGLGGYMPLAVATTGGVLNWVHAGHMGVPAVYTNASGAAVAPPSGYSAPGFPGQNQTFADLYYNRYRDYDSGTGRYIQADPIGLDGGASPYSYAMNNPLRYTDPTGEFAQVVGGAAFGAGVEYLTNPCATGGDILLAGAIGGVGGGGLGIGLKALGRGGKAARGAEGVVKGSAGGARAGKPFTRAGKAEVKANNATSNGGRPTCMKCGTQTTPSQQSKKGVTPSKKETNVDHKIAKSKGGDGSPSNGQVLCRDCNLKKGAN